MFVLDILVYPTCFICNYRRHSGGANTNILLDDEVLTFNGDARLISGANRAREIITERDSN